MVTMSSRMRSKSSLKPVQPVLYECAIDENLALEVAKRSKAVVLQADRILFRQGDEPDGVYFLRKGDVTLTMQSADRVVMCALAGAGSLLGLPSTFSEKPYSMTAVVSEKAEIEHLSCKEFQELITARPELYLNVVQILAAEVRSVRQALAELTS